MAVVHKGDRSLDGQARQYLMTSGVCVIMLVAYMMMVVKGAELELATLALPAMWVVGIFYYLRKYRIFKAGAQGESELLAYVKRLPNQYHVFTNYMVKDKRIRDEIDFLIVGFNGVFVVEAKNHVGRIVGNADDVEWKQYKVDKHGKPYTKNMMNPVKQAQWHTANIGGLLGRLGYQVSVKGLLVFTNPKAKLEIEPHKMTTLYGCEEVNSYILNHVPKRKLAKGEIQQIVEALETSIKKQ